jgi:hypothetical protein
VFGQRADDKLKRVTATLPVCAGISGPTPTQLVPQFTFAPFVEGCRTGSCSKSWSSRPPIKRLAGCLSGLDGHANPVVFIYLPGYDDQLSCAKTCENLMGYNGCSTSKCWCSPEDFVPGGELYMSTWALRVFVLQRRFLPPRQLQSVYFPPTVFQKDLRTWLLWL